MKGTFPFADDVCNKNKNSIFETAVVAFRSFICFGLLFVPGIEPGLLTCSTELHTQVLGKEICQLALSFLANMVKKQMPNKRQIGPAVVVHVFNPSAREAEADL